MSATLLVIDDHDIFRNVLVDLLEEENYKVLSAPDGNAGIEIAKKQKIDVAIVDIVLPGINGIKTIEILKKDSPEIKSIVITGQPQNVSMRDIVLARADDYITKPFEIDDLVHSIQKLLRERRLEQRNTDLQSELIKKEKLALIGKLASFIVHDIKNPLSNIKSLVGEIKTNENLPLVDIIEKSINNLFELTGNLLVLSNTNKFEMDLYPAFVLKDKIKQIIESLSRDINFEYDAKSYVEINLEYFSRIVKNLLINSLDAVKTREEKNVEIHIKETQRFIDVIVLNNGPKIKNVETIFQPFFTTKKSGTGLGLTIVRDLSEKMNIKLNVTSSDKVTQFKLKLKRTRPD